MHLEVSVTGADGGGRNVAELQGAELANLLRTWVSPRTCSEGAGGGLGVQVRSSGGWSTCPSARPARGCAARTSEHICAPLL